jgi:hypothetical protein
VYASFWVALKTLLHVQPAQGRLARCGLIAITDCGGLCDTSQASGAHFILLLLCDSSWMLTWVDLVLSNRRSVTLCHQAIRLVGRHGPCPGRGKGATQSAYHTTTKWRLFYQVPNTCTVCSLLERCVERMEEHCARPEVPIGSISWVPVAAARFLRHRE